MAYSSFCVQPVRVQASSYALNRLSHRFFFLTRWKMSPPNNSRKNVPNKGNEEARKVPLHTT